MLKLTALSSDLRLYQVTMIMFIKLNNLIIRKNGRCYACFWKLHVHLAYDIVQYSTRVYSRFLKDRYSLSVTKQMSHLDNNFTSSEAHILCNY
jgi:hypothetical protein